MHAADSLHQHQNHIAHFDTDLMDQIIEVEVDTAVRTLEAQGKKIDPTLPHLWNRSLREMLNHIVLEEQGNHCILPRDFQQTLQNMLQNLIDADSDSISDQKKTSDSPSFLQKMQTFFARTGGKNMPS